MQNPDGSVRKKTVNRTDVCLCSVLVLLGTAAGTSHRSSQQPQFLVFPPETGTNYCLLLRTVDGDSVRLGLIIDVNTRLYGIDTPERGQEGFKEATDRLTAQKADLAERAQGNAGGPTEGYRSGEQSNLG